MFSDWVVRHGDNTKQLVAGLARSGMRPEQIAEVAHVSSSTVAQWLRGENKAFNKAAQWSETDVARYKQAMFAHKTRQAHNATAARVKQKLGLR